MPTNINTLLTSRSLGNKDFDSEELIAYEIGYRLQPIDTLTLDFAIFYNDYSNLFNVDFVSDTTTAVIPTIDPNTGLSAQIDVFNTVDFTANINNKMHGEIYGFETNAYWNPVSFWRLSANYSYLDIELHSDSTLKDGELDEKRTPHNQAHIRSYFDLPGNLQFDIALYYVDSIFVRDVLTDSSISSYFRLDARLGWQPVKNLEISVVVQNILDDRHQEFGLTANNVNPSEIPRSIYGAIKWMF